MAVGDAGSTRSIDWTWIYLLIAAPVVVSQFGWPLVSGGAVIAGYDLGQTADLDTFFGSTLDFGRYSHDSGCYFRKLVDDEQVQYMYTETDGAGRIDTCTRSTPENLEPQKRFRPDLMCFVRGNIANLTSSHGMWSIVLVRSRDHCQKHSSRSRPTDVSRRRRRLLIDSCI